MRAMHQRIPTMLSTSVGKESAWDVRLALDRMPTASLASVDGVVMTISITRSPVARAEIGHGRHEPRLEGGCAHRSDLERVEQQIIELQPF